MGGRDLGGGGVGSSVRIAGGAATDSTGAIGAGSNATETGAMVILSAPSIDGATTADRTPLERVAADFVPALKKRLAAVDNLGEP